MCKFTNSSELSELSLDADNYMHWEQVDLWNYQGPLWLLTFTDFFQTLYGYTDFFLIHIKDLHRFIGTQCPNINVEI